MEGKLLEYVDEDYIETDMYVSMVSSYLSYTVVIDLDGYLWVKGRDNIFNLEQPPTNNYAQVLPDTRFKHVSCAAKYCTMIDIEGNLWITDNRQCFRFNESGSTIIGSGFKFVSCTTNIIVAIKEDDSVVFFESKKSIHYKGKYSWVNCYYDYAELITTDGSVERLYGSKLEIVIDFEKYKQVICGRDDYLLSENGELFHYSGEITKIDTDELFTAIGRGCGQTYAITENGTVYSLYGISVTELEIPKCMSLPEQPLACGRTMKSARNI